MIVIEECSGVGRFNIKRIKLTRKIEQVNKDLLKCCQIDLQIIQSRNQMQSLLLMGNVSHQVENLSNQMGGLTVSATVDLCSVPKLDIYPVGLGWPLIDLRRMLFDVAVVGLVVSAREGFGKTTLVTQLCHDAQVKGIINIFVVEVSIFTHEL